jgi:acetyltransferase-like isoleucine patch superfamily enzyme
MSQYRRIAPDVTLGRDVVVRDFVNLYGCRIGDGTRIGTFVEIQRGAEVGARCKISSHTFICEGVSIGSGVFVGHNVSFVNDRYPRAVGPDGALLEDADWTVVPTTVEDCAAIGSGAVILCGVRIGRGAVVGAGAVVTRDVPAREVWAGNPARYLKDVEGD